MRCSSCAAGAALKTSVRIPQGEYEEKMRLPSAGGTGDGGHCCRCAVPGALLMLCDKDFWAGVHTCDIWSGCGKKIKDKKLRGRDTSPIHRRYRWRRGMLRGAVAGTLPTGPWTDGRTRVRTPDDDERHPWRIPLDRPCLLRYLTQTTFKPYKTLSPGGGCAVVGGGVTVVKTAKGNPETMLGLSREWEGSGGRRSRNSTCETT